MSLLNKIKNNCIKILKLVIRTGLIVINDGFICLPVKKNIVMFESFNGKDINDNPAAIYNQLIKDYPEMYKYAYFGIKGNLYKRIHSEYPNIKILKRFHPKWIWYMARAKFWIFNSRMPTWWKKNSQTVYIQTWHGTPLKKLGVDMDQVEMPGANTQKYKNKFVKETRRWNYLVAPNSYSKEIFKHAFLFNNYFLDVGYPRNDVLYNNNNTHYISYLKQNLLDNPNANVITYAPTWRDDDYIQKGKYKFELKFNLHHFFEQVNSNTILIIRPHYLVKDHIDISGYENRVKIMTDQDISDIYLITDLLITDYSSVMFDYANLNRPMLFFSYDLNHYRNQLRGFYFNYENDIPGPLVQNADELYLKLNEYTKYHKFNQYDQKMKRFRQKYCTWESGQSSKQIINLLEEYLNYE